jgi:hypothetical protein
MLLATLIRNSNKGAGRKRLDRRRTFVPRLHVLEDRTLPSTFTVTNLLDSGTGSLRAAIAAANANPGANVVNFAQGLQGTITLGSELDVTNSVSLNGPGAGTLAISGNNAYRVFYFAGGTTDNLSGLTIENGYVDVNSPLGMDGGGILNSGSLTVNNCAIVNNYVTGMDMGFGGGIYNNNILNVSNSTIAHNTANGYMGGGWGGGVFNNMNPLAAPHSPPGYRLPSIVTISNTTIADNTADNGAGILNYPDYPHSQTQMTITNSTISGNTANGYVGGIRNGGILNMHDTIVAGNAAAVISGYATGPDIYGNLFSSGYNLIGTTQGASGFAATDLLGVNPLLGSLQNNGGPTPTMALLSGSPAIDAGDPNFTGPAYDQRGPGFARVVNGRVDIGAFEVQKPGGLFAMTVPSSLTASIAFSMTVEAIDSAGKPLTGYTGTVHFTSSDPQALLPSDYTFTAADAGVHTFSATLETPGSQWIHVADPTQTLAAGNVAGIVVNAPAIHISGPASTMAGAMFNFTVEATDSSGRVLTGYAGTVHFMSSDGQAVLPADYTFTTADAGVHTFGAALKTAGGQSITATDTAYGTHAASSVSVSALAANHLGISTPATYAAGSTQAVTVTALDPFNNRASSYTGTIHFMSTDAGALLPADYTLTSADQGSHTFAGGLTLKTVGTQTVTATDTGDGTISGAALVAVDPVLKVAGFPSATTAGQAQNVSVTALDGFGNTVTGYTGTVHFTSSDARALLPADYTFAAADQGAHTFSEALKTAGTQWIAATAAAASVTTGTESGIVVSPAAASHLAISGPRQVPSSYAFTITVTAVDPYGNVATSYAGPVHFTSSDPLATLPPNYTFTQADQGKHTFTGAVILRTRGVQTLSATDLLFSSIFYKASVAVV